MVIVLIVSALVVADLWRAGRQATVSRTAFLVGGIARAAIPLSVAIALAAWQYIAALNQIAADGSGGLTVVVTAAERLIQTLEAGVVGFAVALIVALVMAVRVRSTASAEPVASRTVAAAIGAMAVVGAIGAAWAAMASTERVSIVVLGPMLRGGVIARDMPGPDPAVATAPSAYTSYLRMSGQEAARESERLVTTGAIGVGLSVVLVGLSLAASRIFASLEPSGPKWAIARAGAVVLAAGAVWWAVQLKAGADWLGTVIAR